MAKTLEDFKKGGYEQIEWPEDGEINVIYLGQEVVDTSYGERVKLAVYDMIAGKETAIYTSSAKLLKLLFDELKIKSEDKVAIKRTGSGYKTNYTAGIIERNEPAPAAGPATKQAPVEQAVTAKEAPASKVKKVSVADAAPF